MKSIKSNPISGGTSLKEKAENSEINYSRCKERIVNSFQNMWRVRRNAPLDYINDSMLKINRTNHF